MSDAAVFDEIVRACEFYAFSDDEIEVDLENYHIRVNGYDIDPVMRDGHLVRYLVEDPQGVRLFVDDLDSYFQSELDWEAMT